MAGNIFGSHFRLATFGESHGAAIGGIIEGCPAGLIFDYMLVERLMHRRRPGSSNAVSARKEADEVEWLSGIFEGKTTGTPIGFIIRNQDAKSSDYDELKDVFRPSHADYGYHAKYGVRDHRGGGRASARETAARVAGGAVAMMLLDESGIEISAAATAIGRFELAYPDWIGFVSKCSISGIFADASKQEEIEAYLAELKSAGDSTGGKVSCIVRNCPAGLGEPVFRKLNADLAAAMMSVPASKGIEFGIGMEACGGLGSEMNDSWITDPQGFIRTERNLAGGIVGGLSTGEEIHFTVGFKPASSIGRRQTTVDSSGSEVDIEIRGRHDPCVVPRAVVVVEAMTALVIADALLENRMARL